MPDDFIRISVVYALAERQIVIELPLKRGTSVEQAVELSGLRRRFPEIAAEPLSCAIYSRAVPLTEQVEDGDRVEVLRPLLVDPKENRRQIAARTRAKSV